jgi:hypothetical protein
MFALLTRNVISSDVLFEFVMQLVQNEDTPLSSLIRRRAQKRIKK